MSKARQNPGSRARAETVWTPERVAAVAHRHAAGAFLVTACRLERGSYDGLRDALARHPEWRADIDEAHAKWEVELQERARNAEGEAARTARWELERWSRETFAPPTTKVEAKNEHSGVAGGGIQILVASPEELRKLAAPKIPEDE